MAPLLRFESVERGFARNVVERHSPQAGFYADRLVESDAVHSVSNPVSFKRRDTIDTPSGVPVVSTPSLTASTKALAGLIVFLGIVVLGVAGLRLRKFLCSRTKVSRSPHLKPLSLCESPLPEKITSEKRNPMYTRTLIDFGYDGLCPPSKAWTQPEKSDLVYSDSEAQYAGWVPQIRSLPGDTKGSSSPDLIPRPFLALPPPAAAVVKLSRFSRLATVFTRSPRPSETSFDLDVVPPYTSTAPTPRSWTPAVTASPSPSTPDPSSSSSQISDHELSSTKAQKNQKPPRNLAPIRIAAPSTKVSRVPVPIFDPLSVPEVTVEGTAQTVLINAGSNAMAGGSAIKSPARVDSASLAGAFPSDVKSGMLQAPKSLGRTNRESSSSSRDSSSRMSFNKADRESGEKVGTLEKKIPRLVTVVNVFSPNLDDELHVHLGEVLRLTHEFRDGWCAVERIGTSEERGVIPLFCVVDRASIVPDPRKSHNSTRLTFTGSTSYSLNATVATLSVKGTA